MTAYDRAIEALKEDSVRYQWLKSKFCGADFEYGEPSTSVIVFFWPMGVPISADLDACIDEARIEDEAL